MKIKLNDIYQYWSAKWKYTAKYEIGIPLISSRLSTPTTIIDKVDIRRNDFVVVNSHDYQILQCIFQNSFKDKRDIDFMFLDPKKAFFYPCITLNEIQISGIWWTNYNLACFL